MIQMNSTYDELLSIKEISVLDSVLLKYLHATSDNVKIKPSFLTRVIGEKIKYQLVQERMSAKLIHKKYLDPADFDEFVFISEEPMDIILLKRAVKKGYDIIGLDNLIIHEQPSFIAVGVRHLPGENGLIDLLRKEG